MLLLGEGWPGGLERAEGGEERDERHLGLVTTQKTSVCNTYDTEGHFRGRYNKAMYNALYII